MAAENGTSRGDMPWGRFRLSDGTPRRFRLPPLGLLVMKTGNEIRVATVRDETAEASAPPFSENASWTRWASPEDPEELELLPAFPDRPLVLRPEDPLHLLPGARARIYVWTPVWIQLRVPGKRGITIMDVPSTALSETWWGDAQAGELCYWLQILARREAPSETFRPDRIICPVDLVNEAGEELPVEKILLRCEHFSVFREANSLWSDEIRVRYRGEEVGSDLEVTGRSPPEAPQAARLNPPRVPVVRGFRARTFARLKAFQGLGGSA